MIILKNDSELTGFQNAFISLYELPEDPSDPELIKEDLLVLEIENDVVSGRIQVNDNGTLFSNFDYDPYVKNGSDFANEECLYWANEIFGSENNLFSLIDYLKEYPLSKRAIKLFWKDEYKDLSKPSSCISQMFFRIKYDTLEVHTLMRANDGYRCLLIDLDSLRAVQDFVAKKLNLKVGKYIHMVDSFHFYKTAKQDIDDLYKKLKE